MACKLEALSMQTGLELTGLVCAFKLRLFRRYRECPPPSVRSRPAANRSTILELASGDRAALRPPPDVKARSAEYALRGEGWSGQEECLAGEL